MSAPTMQSTSVLTEHLQYPAVSLVDDIINAVNELMYKCTAAMERYLLDRCVIGGVDHTDEIKVGVAKLETLLENSVDKNFDKLELYVLRNVLSIPQDLLDANVFRLAYQRDLRIVDETEQEHSVRDIHDKVHQIELAMGLHRQLTAQVKSAKLLQSKVRNFKKLLVQLLECREPEMQEVFRSLKPLDDSIRLITSQLKQLYVESEEYGSADQIESLSRRAQASRASLKSRATYIDSKTKIILDAVNKPENTSRTPREAPMAPSSCVIEDPDLELLDAALT
ncbi:hypothetical protein HG536_0F04170 [Torulaspora globosa]|uniref:Mis12 domain-containing protein n=1 Tax=Torulaspora globosa TaxID=48254 RepID=A0A7G3ZKQ5_9SACH|nr:uncharacterized protein HG536_0F04170 [Torulaspora globosa]QLL34091.1 hypothetical protein HG536_0F04170 [Torulaspora globosa]